MELVSDNAIKFVKIVFFNLFFFLPVCLYWIFAIFFFLFSKKIIAYLEISKILIEKNYSENLNFLLKNHLIQVYYTGCNDLSTIYHIFYPIGENNVIHLKSKKDGKSYYIHFFMKNKKDLDEFENVLKEWYKSGIEFQYKKRLKKINVDEYFGEKGVR